MVLAKQESLEKKVKRLEYRARIQKVSSFFRLAIHSAYNLRIYLNKKEFGEYPLGQEFAISKVYAKQDVIEMLEYDDRLDSIELPILMCFPEKEKKEISK